VKMLASIIGIAISLFGLFVISICSDVLFAGDGKSDLEALFYLLAMTALGYVPYFLGAFVCFLGWTKHRKVDSKHGAFVRILFSFKGRVNRRSFWMVTLFVVGPYTILDLQRDAGMDSGASPWGILGAVLLTFFLMLWPGLAVQVKRWHDLDKSGFWSLINIIPIIGSIWTLVMCGGKKGTDGPNRYGDGPLTHEPQLPLEKIRDSQA
jgi:uncharacterized membrane protein YhaH (DUF805 family)